MNYISMCELDAAEIIRSAQQATSVIVPTGSGEQLQIVWRSAGEARFDRIVARLGLADRLVQRTDCDDVGVAVSAQEIEACLRVCEPPEQKSAGPAAWFVHFDLVTELDGRMQAFHAIPLAHPRGRMQFRAFAAAVQIGEHLPQIQLQPNGRDLGTAQLIPFGTIELLEINVQDVA